MSFTCPKCFAPASLDITSLIELPPDNRSDEITLQLIECRQCGFQGLAVYAETRRGHLETDQWEHQGYLVDKGVFEAISDFIQSCPDPNNTRCQCPSHQTLGKYDRQGRWEGLSGVKIHGTFNMILGNPSEN